MDPRQGRRLFDQGLGRFGTLPIGSLGQEKDGSIIDRYFEGVIRKDPVDKNEVVVAGFTGIRTPLEHQVGREREDHESGFAFLFR